MIDNKIILKFNEPFSDEFMKNVKKNNCCSEKFIEDIKQVSQHNTLEDLYDYLFNYFDSITYKENNLGLIACELNKQLYFGILEKN